MITTVGARLVTGDADKLLENFSHNVDEIDGSQFREKKGTHWSQYSSGIIAVAGLVAAVAGYALGQIPLMVLGGLLCLSNTVSFYYLRKFLWLKSLDDEVRFYKQQNQEFKGENKTLRDNNKTLKEQLSDFSSDITRAERQQKDEKEMFSKKLEELADLTKKFKAKEEELGRLRGLYDKVKATTGSLAEQAAKFNEANQKMAGVVVDIGQRTAELEKAKAAFLEGLGNLQTQNEETKQQNAEIANLVAQLEVQQNTMQGLCNKLGQERDLLQKEITNLSKVQGQVVQQATETRKAGDDLVHATENLDKALDKLHEAKQVGELAGGLKGLLQRVAAKQQGQSAAPAA